MVGYEDTVTIHWDRILVWNLEFSIWDLGFGTWDLGRAGMI